MTPHATPPRELGPVGLGILLVAYLMTMMDNFVVNVALPTIARELGLGTTALELVVAGYTLAFTVFLVLGGRLGDMYGRRRVLAIGLVGFTLTSLLCGLAWSGPSLVAFRILQGAFAALLPSQVLGTIQATTHGTLRQKALSLYASTGGVALALGQVLGGVLLHADLAGTSWRPLFVINVPLGVLALLGLTTVPESRSPLAARVDVAGTLLLAATLLAALVPLSQGRALGWPWWIWLVLAAAVPLGVALWRTERRQERAGHTPLLPPALLARRQVHRGLGIAVPFFVGFGSFMFVFALTAQGYLHRSALASALGILPMGLAFFAGAFLTRRLLDRFGSRTLVAGGVVQALGLAGTALPVLLGGADISLLLLAPGLALAGLGQAMIFGASFRTVLEHVPAELAGVGSGVLVTCQQAALTAGVAVLGTLYEMLDSRSGGAVAFVVVVAVQIGFAGYITLAEKGVRD